jgi:hypothetical protein
MTTTNDNGSRIPLSFDKMVALGVLIPTERPDTCVFDPRIEALPADFKAALINGARKFTDDKILTPRHSRWREFVFRLEHAIVITFDPLEWRCEGEGDYRYSKQVLSEMGGIDATQTLMFLADYGANCDCEILDNIAWHDRWESSPPKKS